MPRADMQHSSSRTPAQTELEFETDLDDREGGEADFKKMRNGSVSAMQLDILNRHNSDQTIHADETIKLVIHGPITLNDLSYLTQNSHLIASLGNLVLMSDGYSYQEIYTKSATFGLKAPTSVLYSLPSTKEVARNIILENLLNDLMTSDLDIENKNFFNPLTQARIVFPVAKFKCQHRFEAVEMFDDQHERCPFENCNAPKIYINKKPQIILDKSYMELFALFLKNKGVNINKLFPHFSDYLNQLDEFLYEYNKNGQHHDFLKNRRQTFLNWKNATTIINYLISGGLIALAGYLTSKNYLSDKSEKGWPLAIENARLQFIEKYCKPDVTCSENNAYAIFNLQQIAFATVGPLFRTLFRLVGSCLNHHRPTAINLERAFFFIAQLLPLAGIGALAKYILQPGYPLKEIAENELCELNKFSFNGTACGDLLIPQLPAEFKKLLSLGAKDSSYAPLIASITAIIFLSLCIDCCMRRKPRLADNVKLYSADENQLRRLKGP